MRHLLLSALLGAMLVAVNAENEGKEGEEKEFAKKRLNDFGDYYDASAYPPYPQRPYAPYRQPVTYNRYPQVNYGGNQPNYGSYGTQNQNGNSFFDLVRDTIRKFDEETDPAGYGQNRPENAFQVENTDGDVSRNPFNVGTPRRMPASYDFSTGMVPQAQSGVYMSNRGYSYMGYIEKQVKMYPVMIYTLVQCVPCQRAKHMLAISYPDVRSHFLEITGNEDWQRQLQVDLHHLTGAVTFPYIFVCGSYIGGSSDLMQLHQTGQLRQMVNACSRMA